MNHACLPDRQVSRMTYQKKGFSLIELTVSIAILVLLTAIAVGSYRNGERRRRLALSADGVISALRLAQSYALSGKQIDATSCSSKAPKDYRVEFSNNSTEYTVQAEDICGNPLFEIQKYKLPEQIRINPSNGLRLNGSAANTLSIMFTPPFAAVQASANSGSFATFTTAVVTLELNDGSASKSVTVDGVSGRIGE